VPKDISRVEVLFGLPAYGQVWHYGRLDQHFSGNERRYHNGIQVRTFIRQKRE
jgi:hypothetical protein